MHRGTVVGLIFAASIVAAWASCAVYDTSLLVPGDGGIGPGDGGTYAFACN